MDRTPTPLPTQLPTRLPARLLRRTLVGAGVVGGTLVAATGVASASEFHTDPDSSVSVECPAGQQPFASVTLTNLLANMPASFVVTVDGATVADLQVGIGESSTFGTGLTEDQPSTLQVFEGGVLVDTYELDPDCFGEPTATIVPVCDEGGMRINVAWDNPTPFEINVSGHVNGEWRSQVHPAFASGTGYLMHVLDGPWEAEVGVDQVTTDAQSGVADCTQPGATAEVVCTASGPDLVVTLADDDTSWIQYELDVTAELRPTQAATPAAPIDVLPGSGDVVRTYELVEASAWSATASAFGESVLDASGTADCTEDVVEQTPTTTVTTVPEPVPTVPTPTVPAPVIEAQPPAPSPMLPSTGRASRSIATVGLGSLVAGLWLTIAVRRRRDA